MLEQIADLTGLNQTRLAKAVGVSQGTISKWRNGQQSPGKEEWDRVTDLIRRDRRLESMRFQFTGSDIPVMGRIGAGAVIEPDFEQVPPEGLSQVSLPFPVPSGMIAFEVAGESMYPKYDPGDVVVVRGGEQIKSTESFIGEIAAIRTQDGHRYLKRLFAGTKSGLFRLESFNAQPIHDVAIIWIGEIFTVIPKNQIFGAEPPRSAPRHARR